MKAYVIHGKSLRDYWSVNVTSKNDYGFKFYRNH